MSKQRPGTAEIGIFSDIGAAGLTAGDFDTALKALGSVRLLNVRINSDGGDVAAGFAIYNMLARHQAKKIVTIEGLAASMASVVAMAGDEIVMPSNAMMMIHNPFGGVVGNADAVQSFGEALESMQGSIVATYVRRTKLDAAKVQEVMDRDTWLSADEAV
jgi:ATP-dependent Clp endopeptidase proteolytic subunit ClpP